MKGEVTPMPTVKDVAELAGVSPSTVSIVVNGKQNERKISKETQERVHKAILQLNYQPNVSAKKLRNNADTEYMIAVYWASDSRTVSVARLIKGIQETMDIHHYPVNIIICPYKNDFLCEEKGLQTNNLFHAAIIANTSAKDMEFLEGFTPNIPTVLYNRYSEKYNTVTINSLDLEEKIVNAISARKPKRVGAMLMENPYLGIKIRRDCFFKACAEQHIDMVPENIVYSSADTVAAGMKAIEELLTHDALPDVLYCESDGMAHGALRALQQHHIAVPQDMGVISVCMGIPEVCEITVPALTVADIPAEQLATKSLDLIVKVLRQHITTPCHETCTTELIKRESL